MSGPGLVLYRIVRVGSPAADDFLSRMMLGFPPRRTEREQPEIWAGLSMFDSADRARARAREFPALGAFIATISVDARRVVTRQTLGPGHYTVWGAPVVLLTAVMIVAPV